MSKRRATIARRLVEAQHNAAMLTTFNEVDMSAVMSLRERRKEAFTKQYGVGLGIASFFVKAAIGALKAFPQLNAEIQGDEIVYKHYYDIGMAVGAEGGLVVPVIRDADAEDLRRDRTVDPRLRQARAGRHADARGSQGRHVHHHQRRRLRLAHEHADPQPAASRHSRPAQDRGSTAWSLNGQVVIRPMMYLALSYDHRIVDGREAVQFLVRIKVHRGPRLDGHRVVGRHSNTGSSGSQHLVRICPAGAASREPAGEHRAAREEERHATKHHRIKRAHAEEQPIHQSGQRQRAANP